MTRPAVRTTARLAPCLAAAAALALAGVALAEDAMPADMPMSAELKPDMKSDMKMDKGMMKDGMMDPAMMPAMYEVTITNLTTGQPFSPPLLATHAPSVSIFQKGEPASKSLKMVAEGGKTLMLAGELGKAAEDMKVTDVVATGMGYKIMPGQSATFTVAAKPGDVLSAVTMLAATNDGFTGVSGMKLDGTGPMTMEAMAMDAGTEDNTEKKMDVPAPAMGMGMAPTTPPVPVMEHKGITGKGDLDKKMFDWSGPVARIEVKKAAMKDPMMMKDGMMKDGMMKDGMMKGDCMKKMDGDAMKK